MQAALSSHIAGRLDLTKANVAVSAGGNFILLLPNTKSVKEEIGRIQLESERYFLKEFAAKPAVIISDGVEASQRDVQSNLVKNSFIQISGEKLLHFGQMAHLSRKCPDKSWASINAFEPGQACLFMPYSAPHKDGNEDGELLTFEEIAQKARGNKKLAMLKADVDNLGLIFSSGFYSHKEERSRGSFSKYAELSYMLQYFSPFGGDSSCLL